MIALKAAKAKDQKELDQELSRFEKIFPKLESSEEGERLSAATKVINSLAKINQLQGKSPGQSGYFGLRDILQGADSAPVAAELARAKELIAEYEVDKKNLELAERRLQEKVEQLLAEIDRLSTAPSGQGNSVAGRKGARSQKEFARGALGIAIVVSIVMAGIVRRYEWGEIFAFSLFGILLIVWSMQFVGGWLLKISDAVVYRVALCGPGLVPGLKALAFSLILLVIAGITGKMAGAESFLGVDLPPELSGLGIVEWTMVAAFEVFGLLFLAACAGVYLVIRRRARAWNLPGRVAAVLF
jgi:hypothetical protein